jgi:hypothetical protein
MGYRQKSKNNPRKVSVSVKGNPSKTEKSQTKPFYFSQIPQKKTVSPPGAILAKAK